ncbi:MAG: hypothetical protein SVM79_00115 [Chloroflexota bacterium]|nr:hypothetical protein [Chloroflexota bacterium]
MIELKIAALLAIVIVPAIGGLYFGFKPSVGINDVVLTIGVAATIVISFTVFYYIGAGLSCIVRCFST